MIGYLGDRAVSIGKRGGVYWKKTKRYLSNLERVCVWWPKPEEMNIIPFVPADIEHIIMSYKRQLESKTLWINAFIAGSSSREIETLQFHMLNQCLHMGQLLWMVESTFPRNHRLARRAKAVQRYY